MSSGRSNGFKHDEKLEFATKIETICSAGASHYWLKSTATETYFRYII